MAFNFQLDEHAVPVFYITKNSFTSNLIKVISLCLKERWCYVLVETEKSPTNIVEYTFTCQFDFDRYIDKISELIND